MPCGRCSSTITGAGLRHSLLIIRHNCRSVRCEAQRCIHSPLSTRLSSSGCFLCGVTCCYLFFSTLILIILLFRYGTLYTVASCLSSPEFLDRILKKGRILMEYSLFTYVSPKTRIQISSPALPTLFMTCDILTDDVSKKSQYYLASVLSALFLYHA